MDNTESDYEQFGIVPEAFYDPVVDIIHTSHTTFMLALSGVIWALKLLIHEFGHAAGWPKNDHATDLRDGLKHALSVGFDVRAYTRYLRWFQGNRQRWILGYTWFQNHAELVQVGV